MGINEEDWFAKKPFCPNFVSKITVSDLEQAELVF